MRRPASWPMPPDKVRVDKALVDKALVEMARNEARRAVVRPISVEKDQSSDGVAA